MLRNLIKLSKYPQFKHQTLTRRWKSAQSALIEAKTSLENYKISESSESAEIILAHILKQNSLENLRKNAGNIELTDAEEREFEELCEARKCRMPVQYIIKNWDFRKLNLKMVPPVFIPRPETEKLVELVAQNEKEKSTDQKLFLEIGTGSGAICLSILHEMKNVKFVAIDQSRIACNLTMENAKMHNLSDRIRLFQHKLVDTNLPKEIFPSENCFDLIVSNPPYVKTADLSKLEDEIKIFEDLRALDGGKDGLNTIRIILDVASKYLKPGGKLWLETDCSQHSAIENLVTNLKDLKFVASYQDIFEKDRFVEIVKK